MATSAEIREYFAKVGRKGGKARLKTMSPEERKERARNAAAARWADRPKKKAKASR
jgi:hypothetical protein